MVDIKRLQEAMAREDSEACYQEIKHLFEHAQPTGANRIDRAISQSEKGVDAAERQNPKPDRDHDHVHVPSEGGRDVAKPRRAGGGTTP